MVYASTFWLNAFPPADGVSESLSPRAIIVALQLDYSKHCQLEFSTYAQTHEEHDNSMVSRTTGALALRPTGNIPGGDYFFSLTSGRRINPNRWTPLPMPADVIDRVHTLARRTNASLGLEFTERDGNLIITADEEYDSDDDDSYHPSKHSDSDTDGDDSTNPDLAPPEDEADQTPMEEVDDNRNENNEDADPEEDGNEDPEEDGISFHDEERGQRKPTFTTSPSSHRSGIRI
jgi:hypothetical protein